MAVTLAEKTIELEKRIQQAITDPELIKVTKTGKFYVADKNEYSFEVYFIYNDKDTVWTDKYGNQTTIKPIFTKPTVDFIKYNLKDRIYSIERNGKEIEFNEDNLRKSFQQMYAEEMSFLEVEGNKGFYVATRPLGRSGNERQKQISRQLVNLIENYPGVEFVYKAGLYNKNWEDNRWNEFKYVHPSATNLLDFFGFTMKSQLKLYRRLIDIDGYQNDRMKMIRELTEEDILYIRDILDLAEVYNHKYGLNKYRDILTFFGLKNSYGSPRQTLYENKKYIYNLPRFIEYLFYEADVKQAFTSYRVYIDYIRMSIELGSKFEKYPASIMTSHDIAARYHNMIRYDNGMKDSFLKAVSVLGVYEGDIPNTEYTVVAPKEMEDIIYEGVELSHCVKSHIPAIANEEEIVLFLRNKNTPLKPLYTFSIKNNAVVEAAGYCNCALNDEALKALDIFINTYNLGKAF